MAAFIGLAMFIAILEFKDWDGLRRTLAGATILFGLVSGFWPMYAIVALFLIWGLSFRIKNDAIQLGVMLIGMIGFYTAAAGAAAWGFWRIFLR